MSALRLVVLGAASKGSGKGRIAVVGVAVESHGVEMTEDLQSGNHQVRKADVTSLPFIAGVVLAIGGVITVVKGLYTLTSWWGWFFIGLGVLIGVTGWMLVFRIPWARLAAVVTALVSLGFTAIWVPSDPWFAIPVVGFDALAIFAIARSML